MSTAVTGQPTTGLAGPVSVGVGLLLLFFAPLIRGGNRHVALGVLEVLALGLLVLLAARALHPLSRNDGEWKSGIRGSSPIPMSLLFLALSPVWVGMAQLVPLPPKLWASLPGHELYLTALQAVQMNADTWRPASLAPDATWVSLLAGLPLMAAFLLAALATVGQLAVLARAIVLIAALQALLGLLQIGSGRVLYFDAAMVYDRSIGTFANPNHFACFMAMTLPLSILFLRQALRGARHSDARAYPGRGASALPGLASLTAYFWGAILFVLCAALLASVSRSGIATAVFAAFAATLLLPLVPLRRRAWLWRAGAALLICSVVLATVGGGRLWGRMTGDGLDPSRLLMVRGTWEGIRTYWPFGSGMGTFAGVFPRFQPPGLKGFVEYAHSDILQLLMESGLLFLLLAVIAMVLIIRRAVAIGHLLRADPSDRDAALMASCGLGVLAIFLHSWVEFNLRIPANAVVACFLLGVYLRPLSRRARLMPHLAR